MLQRPVRGRYRNLGPRTARRDKRAPCRATYSEMQSIFTPSTAAGVGGVSRNARKRQGSKHGHLAWNRARLEHCIDGGGRPRILDQSRRLSKFGGQVVLRGQRLRISRSDRGYREGWVIGGKEFVPFEEATPSPDGKMWICRRPDHTRRCVFGPPPGS